jgi:glutamate-ammonia-ligase adenylyltransferase
MGFADPARAEQLLTSDLALDISPEEPAAGPGYGRPRKDEAVLEAIAGAADPDLALQQLARIAGADRGEDPDAAEIRAALRTEPGFRKRLIGVLGISAGLGDHLARHPEDCCLLRGADAIRRPTTDELRAALLYAVGANPLHEDPVADLAFLDGTDPAAALCVAYKRHILHLAAHSTPEAMSASSQAASSVAATPVMSRAARCRMCRL